MKEIIDWLITVEHLANDFYFQSSALFTDDKELTTFLKHIADDEAYHYHIMGSASEYVLRANISRPPSITIDNSTREQIEKPFTDNISLAKNGKLSKEALIDCIIDSEFSEWNDIFLYVVNTIKSEDRVFEHAASKIQYHLKHIEHFLKTTGYGSQQLEKLKKIPSLWKERILIVDDEEAITSLLCAVLKSEWDVDTASNGEEALTKLKQTHYDLIISDVDMPIMDGMELLKNASEIIENLNNKFILHTGNLSPDREEYFKKNRIKYLSKPSSIIEIREFVKGILQKLTIE